MPPPQQADFGSRSPSSSAQGCHRTPATPKGQGSAKDKFKLIKKRKFKEEEVPRFNVNGSDPTLTPRSERSTPSAASSHRIVTSGAPTIAPITAAAICFPPAQNLAVAAASSEEEFEPRLTEIKVAVTTTSAYAQPTLHLNATWVPCPLPAATPEQPEARAITIPLQNNTCLPPRLPGGAA